jgi:hypothetical protein
MCAGDISCLPWSCGLDPWGCGVREPWLTSKDLLPTCLLGPLLFCLHHLGKIYAETAMTAHICEMGLPWMNACRGHRLVLTWTLNKYLGSWCGNTRAAATSVSPSSARGWHLDQSKASVTGKCH